MRSTWAFPDTMRPSAAAITRPTGTVSMIAASRARSAVSASVRISRSDEVAARVRARSSTSEMPVACMAGTPSVPMPRPATASACSGPAICRPRLQANSTDSARVPAPAAIRVARVVRNGARAMPSGTPTATRQPVPLTRA